VEQYYNGPVLKGHWGSYVTCLTVDLVTELLGTVQRHLLHQHGRRDLTRWARLTRLRIELSSKPQYFGLGWNYYPNGLDAASPSKHHTQLTHVADWLSVALDSNNLGRCIITTLGRQCELRSG